MLVSFLCTITQAIISTVVSLMYGIILLYISERSSLICNLLLAAIMPILMIMPTKLCALAVRDLGLCGMIGVITAHVILNAPFAWYALRISHAYTKRIFMQTSHMLGATSLQTYWYVVLPIMQRHIVAVGIMIFLLCFASTSIPLMMMNEQQGMMLDGLLMSAYRASDYGSIISLLTMRSVVIIPCFALVYYYPLPVLSDETSSHVISNSRWCSLMSCCMLAILALPAGIILFTILNYRVWIFLIDMIYMPSYLFLREAIMRSFVIAGVSGIGSVLIAIMLWIIASRVNGWWILLLQVIIYAPYALGSIGTSIMIDSLCAIDGRTSIWSIILSHMILNYPFCYQLLYAIPSHMLYEYSNYAAAYGASRWIQTRTIFVPLMWPVLIQGLVIASSMSLTELGASLVHDVQCMTIPSAIWHARAENNMSMLYGLYAIILIAASCMGYGAHRIKERYVL